MVAQRLRQRTGPREPFLFEDLVDRRLVGCERTRRDDDLAWWATVSDRGKRRTHGALDLGRGALGAAVVEFRTLDRLRPRFFVVQGGQRESASRRLDRLDAGVVFGQVVLQEPARVAADRCRVIEREQHAHLTAAIDRAEELGVQSDQLVGAVEPDAPSLRGERLGVGEGGIDQTRVVDPTLATKAIEFPAKPAKQDCQIPSADVLAGLPEHSVRGHAGLAQVSQRRGQSRQCSRPLSDVEAPAVFGVTSQNPAQERFFQTGREDLGARHAGLAEDRERQRAKMQDLEPEPGGSSFQQALFEVPRQSQSRDDHERGRQFVARVDLGDLVEQRALEDDRIQMRQHLHRRISLGRRPVSRQ